MKKGVEVKRGESQALCGRQKKVMLMKKGTEKKGGESTADEGNNQIKVMLMMLMKERNLVAHRRKHIKKRVKENNKPHSKKFP
jgi:hypothetical protein